MKPSTSSTATGSLKPDSPSSVRESRFSSEEVRSTAKMAAPSVAAMIEPSSSPSVSDRSSSTIAATPPIAAVRRVPKSARLIAGRSTGRMSSQPAVRPPSKRISASAITPIVSARW